MLEYERRISAAKSTARMQCTLQRKEQVLEERRQAVMAAEAAAEMRMQQKEEVSRTHYRGTAGRSRALRNAVSGQRQRRRVVSLWLCMYAKGPWCCRTLLVKRVWAMHELNCCVPHAVCCAPVAAPAARGHQAGGGLPG
jgi:hypothetical protein